MSEPIPSPSYEPLPVNPSLIEEVRCGFNLLFWLKDQAPKETHG